MDSYNDPYKIPIYTFIMVPVFTSPLPIRYFYKESRSIILIIVIIA